MIVAALSSLGPWGPAVGALVLLVYQIIKAKYPSLPLPHVGPAPAPAPDAPPAPAPAHPLLDTLARLFGRVPTGGTLADEVKSVMSILATLGHTGPPAADPMPAR